MTSFNGNIGGLRAQRQLAQASDLLTRSLERLSTGSRINRASDDAAGLSISARLQADSRLYGAAIRNVNDGISLINIADSTLNSQITIIDRLKELATQSANGTLSTQQRGSLQTEYRALLEEFGRLAESSVFNDQQLLSSGTNGGRRQFDFQVGISGRSNTTISVSAGNTLRWSGKLLASEVTGNGDTVLDFNDYLDYLNYSLTDSDNVASAFPNAAEITVVDSQGNSRKVLVAAWEVDGDDNAVSFAAFELKPDGTLEAIATTGVESGFLTAQYDSATGQVSGSASETLTFSGGATAQLNLQMGDLTIVSSGTSSAIDFTNVGSSVHARNALTRLDARASELQQLRGQFGAASARLAITADLLSASRENVEQANSRIRDIDVASESAALVTAQIRQQVATSVLGQSQSLGELLLQLLRS